MIAMIAHQWRQPLNAISAATSVISLKAQRDSLDLSSAKEITSKIYKHIQYLSSTIDDFRDFFKPQKEMKSSSFELILTKALSLTEDSLKNKNIALDITINSHDRFMSYENELIQVVLNLLKNSENALIDRKIHVPKIEINIDKNSFVIVDNAGGISEDIIQKIFDPYFSTKSNKEGTGLGLYMSKIIVEEHCHGKLEVSNSSKGAKFTIELPQGELP
jgi:signal transduction histidine kinase